MLVPNPLQEIKYKLGYLGDHIDFYIEPSTLEAAFKGSPDKLTEIFFKVLAARSYHQIYNKMDYCKSEDNPPDIEAARKAAERVRKTVENIRSKALNSIFQKFKDAFLLNPQSLSYPMLEFLFNNPDRAQKDLKDFKQALVSFSENLGKNLKDKGLWQKLKELSFLILSNGEKSVFLEIFYVKVRIQNQIHTLNRILYGACCNYFPEISENFSHVIELRGEQASYLPKMLEFIEGIIGNGVNVVFTLEECVNFHKTAQFYQMNPIVIKCCEEEIFRLKADFSYMEQSTPACLVSFLPNPTDESYEASVEKASVESDNYNIIEISDEESPLKKARHTGHWEESLPNTNSSQVTFPQNLPTSPSQTFTDEPELFTFNPDQISLFPPLKKPSTPKLKKPLRFKPGVQTSKDILEIRKSLYKKYFHQAQPPELMVQSQTTSQPSHPAPFTQQELPEQNPFMDKIHYIRNLYIISQSAKFKLEEFINSLRELQMQQENDLNNNNSHQRNLNDRQKKIDQRHEALNLMSEEELRFLLSPEDYQEFGLLVFTRQELFRRVQNKYINEIHQILNLWNSHNYDQAQQKTKTFINDLQAVQMLLKEDLKNKKKLDLLLTIMNSRKELINQRYGALALLSENQLVFLLSSEDLEAFKALKLEAVQLVEKTGEFFAAAGNVAERVDA